MAKAQKKVTKEGSNIEKADKQKKAASIFDHISNITDLKIPWEELSEADRKSFSPFMCNRLLSMNSDFIDIVNELQKYTIGQLTSEQTYKLFFDILPKKKQFNKYIKGKKDSKYNPDLIELVRNHFDISRKEAVEYIELYFDDRLNTLKEIVRKYGHTDKEITAMLMISQ